MRFINKIFEHMAKKNEKVIENKVVRNNNLISIIRLETLDGVKKEVVLKEFDIKELKSELKEMDKIKAKMKKLFKEWGVE
jgi:hypothetical protein